MLRLPLRRMRVRLTAQFGRVVALLRDQSIRSIGYEKEADPEEQEARERAWMKKTHRWKLCQTSI